MKFLLTLFALTSLAFSQTKTVSPSGAGLDPITNPSFLTALGATTAGQNVLTLSNPSAIRFLRINADNTVTALSDTDFRTAIGAGSGSTTLTDSLSLASTLSDETGSNLAVFSTSPTLTTPVINVTSDATGDIYYRNAGGLFTRLPIGSTDNVLKVTAGIPAWGAAAGGVTNFTEALTIAAPNATVNTASLTAVVPTTNGDFIIRPKGTGSIIAAIPDSLTAGGNKRGVSAVDFQLSRGAAAQVASGNNSVLVGGFNNTASVPNAVVVGGRDNIVNGGESGFIGGGRSNDASGYYSFVGGGYDNSVAAESATISGGYLNTISPGGTYSVIAGGLQNTANGSQGAVLGGQVNTASGTYSSILGGQSNGASGQYSSVPGGRDNTASGNYSLAMGRYGNTRGIEGMMAHGNGRYISSGDAQHGRYVVSKYVVDTSTYELTSGGGSPGSATNRITLPNNSVFVFDGTCAAKAGANVSSWRFKGTIKRGANAAATALVGAVTIEAPLQDAGASTWTFTIDADTTNGTLRLQATGQAGVSIIYCATVNTTEVIN